MNSQKDARLLRALADAIEELKTFRKQVSELTTNLAEARRKLDEFEAAIVQEDDDADH